MKHMAYWAMKIKEQSMTIDCLEKKNKIQEDFSRKQILKTDLAEEKEHSLLHRIFKIQEVYLKIFLDLTQMGKVSI